MLRGRPLKIKVGVVILEKNKIALIFIEKNKMFLMAGEKNKIIDYLARTYVYKM